MHGKVALVVGSSSGIGMATAFALARLGVNLVMAARNKENLQKAEREIRPFGVKTMIVPTDVTVRQEARGLIKETLKAFGRIDFLLQSAGMYLHRTIRETKIEDIERLMAVNFYGSVYCISEVLPHMLERKIGHICVVSSVAGKKALPFCGAYAATKFAITGFTETLRQELEGTGVCISTIFPARVETPMTADIETPRISSKISPEKVAQAIIRALYHKRKEIFVPCCIPKFLICINGLFPHFTDRLVRFLHLEGSKKNAEE